MAKPEEQPRFDFAAWTQPPGMLTLERLKMQWARHVPASVLESIDLSTFPDLILDQVVFKIRAFVLAERLGARTIERTAHVPATWWDHWKADHPKLTSFWSKLVWKLDRPHDREIVLAVTTTDWATYPHAGVPAKPESTRLLLGPFVRAREIEDVEFTGE